MTTWLAGGGIGHFVTLTVPHARRSDGSVVPLDESFGVVAACFKRFLQGRSWKALRSRYGVHHYLRTIEATWGEANGWHPHVHAIFFTGHLEETDERAFYAELFARWAATLRRDAGLEATASAFHAEPVRNGEGIGRYLVKLGLEMHRSDLKEGKRAGRFTPFQVLDHAGDGEAWALRLWWEWESVTKGRRSMTWSRGAREALGLSAVAPTDEELADEDQGGEIVATIDADTWMRLTTIRGIEARVLQAAERGGAPEVHLLLRTVRQRT